MTTSTKKSQAVIIGADSEENFDLAPFDSFRQGVNIRNLSDLIEQSLGKKLRSNSDFRITLNGADISTKFYDDQLTPSSASTSVWGFGANSRVSERLMHEMEERDLGQLDVSSTPLSWQREDIITAVNAVEVLNARFFVSQQGNVEVDHPEQQLPPENYNFGVKYTNLTNNEITIIYRVFGFGFLIDFEYVAATNTVYFNFKGSGPPTKTNDFVDLINASANINNIISAELLFDEKKDATGDPGDYIDIYGNFYTINQKEISLPASTSFSSSAKFAEELTYKTRPEDLDGRIDVFNVRRSIVLQDTDPRITSAGGVGSTHDGRTMTAETGHGAYELDRVIDPFIGLHPFRDISSLPKKDLKPNIVPYTDNSTRTIDFLGLEDGIPITVESMQKANRERAIIDNAREWDIMGKTGHVRFADESVDSVAYGSMLRR